MVQRALSVQPDPPPQLVRSKADRALHVFNRVYVYTGFPVVREAGTWEALREKTRSF